MKRKCCVKSLEVLALSCLSAQSFLLSKRLVPCSSLPRGQPIPLGQLLLPWDRVTALRPSALHESAVNHSEDKDSFRKEGPFLTFFPLSNYKLNKQTKHSTWASFMCLRLAQRISDREWSLLEAGFNSQLGKKL